MLFGVLTPVVAFAYVGRLRLGIAFLLGTFLVLVAGGWSGAIQIVPGYYAIMLVILALGFVATFYPFWLAWKRPQSYSARWYNRWYHYLWIGLVCAAPGMLWAPNRGELLGYEIFRIPSRSMSSSLSPGDFVVVDTRPQSLRQLSRGDVVTYRPHSTPQQTWVGRLIGLPGETIEVRGGQVRIDGMALNERYAIQSPEQDPAAPLSLTLDADSYFILGDNRPNSDDSRYQGPYSRDQLTGKINAIWLSFLPSRERPLQMERIGGLAPPVYASKASGQPGGSP
ncbi:signal peptidase I [Lysobacter silvisoli]|uniref:Signal peptidase I n=1 Tax=Lysobacter silvisoli TaxID=2293254 RepID=A0A371JX89_9GAMM|nr:signal peptidase I [Lysobacter silvisoli]RDZ26276.1 signal peptidase I [Lysobacter silvisoli]